MNRIICVGDTHGCLNELHELLAKVEWNPAEDRLILVGDLVDRGPDSVGVVRWARENKIEIVRGNHDDRYVKLHKKMKWHSLNPKNVKPRWLVDYPERVAIYEGLSEEDHEFLANAPTSIWLHGLNTVVVHAGFLPGKSMADQEDNTMMHVRFLYDRTTGLTAAHLDAKNGYIQPLNSFFWAERYTEPYDVIYGHHVWDLNEIKIHKNGKGATCYGIDTGAVFGGMLTALVLTPGKEHAIVQIQSKTSTRSRAANK